MFMEMNRVQSDNVNAVRYDKETQEFFVKFNGGSTYVYYSVPQKLVDDFMAAQPHPWSRVGVPRLKNGGYAYKKL